MGWLRDLASLTLVAMAAMVGLIVASAGNGLHVPGGTHFHFAEATPIPAAKPLVAIKLASNGPIDGLKMAAGAPVIDVQTPDTTNLPNPQEALDRIRVKVPNEVASYFDVVLYVSKAAQGSLAQHLYLFHRNARGDLAYEQSFPVSTGRERHEKYFTSTPTGLFELDPDRFESYHYSRTWHAAMPWAMFLNASFGGRQTGIALHSSGRSHAALLGQRASGGCVRLPPEKAAELFHRFAAEERGYVPVFAYDSAAGRTSAYGQLVRNADGKPVMYYGYKVLVVIENYSGGPTLVATLV